MVPVCEMWTLKISTSPHKITGDFLPHAIAKKVSREVIQQQKGVF